MISGLNLGASVDYTLKTDKENPTIWKLGVVPSNLFALITTEAKKRSSEVEGSFQLLQVGLKGWSNFGGNIVYKTEKQVICGVEVDAVPMDIVGKIPLEAVIELANEILVICQQTESERKN